MVLIRIIYQINNTIYWSFGILYEKHSFNIKWLNSGAKLLTPFFDTSTSSCYWQIWLVPVNNRSNFYREYKFCIERYVSLITIFHCNKNMLVFSLKNFQTFKLWVHQTLRFQNDAERLKNSNEQGEKVFSLIIGTNLNIASLRNKYLSDRSPIHTGIICLPAKPRIRCLHLLHVHLFTWVFLERAVRDPCPQCANIWRRETREKTTAYIGFVNDKCSTDILRSYTWGEIEILMELNLKNTLVVFERKKC